jgi:hypothetical protein
MKAEYRITIGQKQEGAQHNGARSTLEVVKAVVLTLLVLSVLIGIFLAAFVAGTIIASILLILIGVSLIGWTVRRLLLGRRKRDRL